ncbi:MAG: ATP-binding protein [Chlorobi bacterium]|nr:ATP-binding protein [Chlorobiota bacterium]
MFRTLSKRLQYWAGQTKRKPVLLSGPRHVGKTWLVNDLAKREYDDLISLDFEEHPALASLFSGDAHPLKILENISIYLGRRIDWENTLLFLDEVQATPGVIHCLGSFATEAPHCHLIAAGSALGSFISKHMHEQESSLQYMTLYPLTFHEYLNATGEELLAGRLSAINPADAFPGIIHEKLLRHLAQYLFLGGMPEVIKTFLESDDLSCARKKQEEILSSLEEDFTVYGKRLQKRRIREVWNSVPAQLNAGNKKFRFNRLREQGRAATFGSSVQWLEVNGLIRVINRMRVPRLMLREYESRSQFRIYPFDTGLSGAMSGLKQELVSHPLKLFGQYHDTLIETCAAAELSAADFTDLFYWSSPADAEVDFLILQGNHIYPVEVKSDTSRRKKNLQSYDRRFHPGRLFAVSPRNFEQQGHFTNLPLYAISSLKNY